MSRRKKAAIQLVVLLSICGLIIWHAVYWHSAGMHLEMFQWLQAGKGYITIIYNLALMLVLGTALGLLMEKTSDLIAGRYGDDSQ